MKFIVKHEINGRLRIHVVQKRMTYTEADTLSWFLSSQKNVTDVKVYERTADAVICYVGAREEVLNLLKQFSYENTNLPEHVAAGSGRELNAVYQEKLVMKLGNAGGVQVTFDGKELPPVGKLGQVKTVTFPKDAQN